MNIQSIKSRALIFIAIFYIISIACSCTNASEKNYLEIICDKEKGFVVDTSRNSDTYKAAMVSKYFLLRPLSVPSDTFFFRIEYTTDSTYKIFQYSHYKSASEYKIYTYMIDQVDNRILFDSAKDKPEQFVKIYDPGIFDMDFIDQMKKYQILELPDHELIQGYPQTDIKPYRIEFSNNCGYGIYDYSDPYLYRSKFPEAKKLTDFINYLRKKSGF
jgi:hypothetical protein